MAPQPPTNQTQVEELPRSVIRAENDMAREGIENDALHEAGATEPLDQNPGGQDDNIERQQKKPQRSPQDDARANIAKRFRREEPDNERPFNGDMSDAENMYGEYARQEPALSDDEYDQLAAETEGQQPQQRQNTQQQDQQPTKRKLKIRGEEVELTDDEILAAARKVKSGDSYLEEARALLEEAKQINRAARSGTERQPHGENQAAQDELDPTGQDVDQPHDPTFKDVVERLQYGDPEEAAQLLEKVVDKKANKASTEGALQRAFDQDLARSQKQLAQFSAANPDLAADRIASMAIGEGMYDLYREEILALGIEESKLPKTKNELANWHRFYRVHGYEVSSTTDLLNKSKDKFLKWKGVSSKPAPQNQQPSRREAPRVRVNVNRDDRRMAIPVQPERGVAPRRDAPPPANGSAVVAQMRKARGQV